MEKYVAKKHGIYLKDTDKLVVTIWPDRKVSDERLENESWLDMMERTEGDRESVQRRREEMAKDLCAFMNNAELSDDGRSSDK